MRTLKFRAWHNEQKRMFPIHGLGKDFVTEDTLDGIDVGVNAFSGENLKHIEVMQYSGLEDSEGTPIYEGDIVYLAGYGDYEVEFPFTDLYEAYPEGDIGEIKGNIHKNKN